MLEPEARRLPLKVPNLVAAPKWTLEPGEEFMALWGTGYDGPGVSGNRAPRQDRSKASGPTGGHPAADQQAVTEALRGGFTLRVTMVRENRAYLTSQQVEVPWTNKKLTVKWEHFVSKLEPPRRRPGRR